MTMTSYGACCIENRCQLKVDLARRLGRNSTSSPKYRLHAEATGPLFKGCSKKQENKLQQKTETVFKEKHGVWDSSPYVHSIPTHEYRGYLMPELTLTLCQSRLYPLVRDKEFGLRKSCRRNTCLVEFISTVKRIRFHKVSDDISSSLSFFCTLFESWLIAHKRADYGS
jgi:hypothetical protein